LRSRTPRWPSLKAACKLAGLGFSTFNGWREEDSFFAQKIEFAEAQAIERNLALIQRAALKDWKAAAWILERRHPGNVCSARGPIKPARLRSVALDQALVAFQLIGKSVKGKAHKLAGGREKVFSPEMTCRRFCCRKGNASKPEDCGIIHEL
jgi:hypothetical protein